ncbi:ABC-2 type transport system permease protein [Sediminihabitans luteus]|uniref:ABC-2 type transport system permease protein n=1 Tax=Sediminihabitans luteus TaxID=1138585 RepID=A0A2M9CD96_9CELL|nr:ABC transporter permease [Sediminihabitans luteus]PJJ69857.1 ABC-2 type transport system permease protein [Sediminihabitans luteus]GII99177.1 ABC transporter permease [Sediminihabitans luteus]
MSTPQQSTRATRAPRSTGAWSAIRLVAGREIRSRVMSKAWIITTAVLVLAVVGGGIVLNLVTSSGPDAQDVGFTSEVTELQQPLVATAEALGTDVVPTAVADRATGEQAVRDGDLAALVTGTPTDLEVVVDADLDSTLSTALTSVSQQAALSAQVTALGGDPDEVATALATSAPEVTALSPGDTTDVAQIAAGLLVGILIFMSIMLSGQLIAAGVVEEKQSRVVEILLASIRPWELLVGKVLGIGTVGFIQIALVAGAGAGTAAALGLVDASELSLGAAAGWLVVWYVIGYLTYAFALAGAASLVSRQEDVGSVIAPFTTLMIVPYVIAISIAPYDTDNTLVRWISYVPFCSPLVMPVRVAVGGVEPWEIALSLGLSILVIPVVVWLAARIYRGAVLRTGARLKVKDVLAGA